MIADEAKEIHWLLHFFSRPLPEQWARLPDEMAPVWLRLGEIDCEVDEPARLLSLVLTGLLNGRGRCFEAGDPRLEEALCTLDELRVGSWLGELWQRPGEVTAEELIARGWDEVISVLDRLGAAVELAV